MQSGALAVVEVLPRRLLACIIHEDSPVSGKMAKQVVRSGEKRGPPRAELDRARCEAIFSSDGE